MRWAGRAGELEKFEGSMKIWAKLSRWGKVDWVPGSSYYTNMKLTNEDFDIKKIDLILPVSDTITRANTITWDNTIMRFFW